MENNINNSVNKNDDSKNILNEKKDFDYGELKLTKRKLNGKIVLGI